MAHDFFIFGYMLLWMLSPIACMALAPRKHRDPYGWVVGAVLAGPPVLLALAWMRPLAETRP
ncbi:MAG TPA: hypothetical protein V6D47_20385 [Oscillatoriaceae cyanobacterium]